MKKTVVPWVACGLCVCTASADVVSLVPVKDNTLYEYSPAAGEQPLSNGKGRYFFAGRTSQNRIRRGLIAFNPAGFVPAGSVITSVRLRLNLSQAVPGDQVMKLHRVLADWGEGRAAASGAEGQGAPADAGSATWLARFYSDTLWNNAGGDFATAPSASFSCGDVGVYTVSSPGMAADVQAWLEDPAGDFGWCLVGAEDAGGGTAKRFDSRDNATAANRPSLVVEFTPPVACPGDYNQDGGIDGSDVEAFFVDWEAGDAAADMNMDGGVDGSDAEAFFFHWEGGC